MTAFMHIYGQPSWHDEAIIVANTEALLAMKKAIEEALEKGHGCAETFQGDGEGYNTVIVKQEDKVFDKLANAYTGETASVEHREDAIWPWQMPGVRQTIIEYYDAQGRRIDEQGRLLSKEDQRND